jgi:hypothetical protein
MFVHVYVNGKAGVHTKNSVTLGFHALTDIQR